MGSLKVIRFVSFEFVFLNVRVGSFSGVLGYLLGKFRGINLRNVEFIVENGLGSF